MSDQQNMKQTPNKPTAHPKRMLLTLRGDQDDYDRFSEVIQRAEAANRSV
jgi:hypothetical protein